MVLPPEIFELCISGISIPDCHLVFHGFPSVWMQLWSHYIERKGLRAFHYLDYWLLIASFPAEVMCEEYGGPIPDGRLLWDDS